MLASPAAPPETEDSRDSRVKGAAQTRLRRDCQARRRQRIVDESPGSICKTVAEWVRRVIEERRFRADERASLDAWRDAAVAAGFEGRAKAAADDAFLDPDFAGAQLSVGCEARELGARSRSARRSIVGPAGAEDKIAAVRIARSRGGENLDMVDRRAVLAGDRLGRERLANGGR